MIYQRCARLACVVAAAGAMGWTTLGLERAGAQPAESIPRTLPPPGIEISEEDASRLKQILSEQEQRLQELTRSAPEQQRTLLIDIEIYHKAVRYALENGEFFNDKDVSRADDLLKTAADRIEQLSNSSAENWTGQRGLLVRGYRSAVDGSPQPYGLVIPENLDLSKPVPLYVWLHGRGDKTTDLQFIHQRQTSVGQIAPENAIVLHPFGRYCNAFKFAGETDVFEAIESVARQYPIDRRRIVLWGFSMGGAGAWHMGAHYPDRWVAISPGAGFAETARYQNLDPSMVPDAERILWGMYDVPPYARNLLNVPVIAYSGENDKQIQAARVMEEALEEQGLRLKHLIGPGMGHKYHPDTLKELAALIDQEVTKGQDPYPREVHLQTRTLRYNRCKWLSIEGLEEHWKDARVDADVVGHQTIRITTKNVTRLSVDLPWRPGSGFSNQRTVEIDGDAKELDLRLYSGGFNLTKNAATGAWALSQRGGFGQFDGTARRGGFGQFDGTARRGSGQSPSTANKLVKSPGLQGPIDDIFFEPFLMVLPSGKSSHEQVEKWVAAESKHFQDRWRRLFRGDLRIKMDHDVTDDDLQRYHVLLWGDRASNRLMAKVVDSLPIQWTLGEVKVGQQSFPAAEHVLAAIYPNPESPAKYVVLNSGLTFRERHDRTNSQQNAKLPDWAVIDLSQPPDDVLPGKIAASGFFDESWQLKP